MQFKVMLNPPVAAAAPWAKPFWYLFGHFLAIFAVFRVKFFRIKNYLFLLHQEEYLPLIQKTFLQASRVQKISFIM
jgi:hypothetical protein